MKRAFSIVLALLLCLAVLQPALAETLKKGSKGAEVRALQERLKELGYLKGKVTGTYTAKTQDAVRAFKGQANLPYDDIADDATQEALFDADAPACIDFDYALMSDYIEAYYFDDVAGRWYWESSACYLDEESWPREVSRDEPYYVMGVYATGAESGKSNRITWKFFCFAEEAFIPKTLTVAFPDGTVYTAKIAAAHRSVTSFPHEVGSCTTISAGLGSRGIEILCRLAHMSDDELDGVAITLSDGDTDAVMDLRQSSISYDPFINDLRTFVKAWGAAGGFSAAMLKENNTFVQFKVQKS